MNLVKKASKENEGFLYSNHRLLASLIDAFMKCHDVNNAELLFDKINTKTKTLHMYGAMMKGMIFLRQNKSLLFKFLFRLHRK